MDKKRHTYESAYTLYEDQGLTLNAFKSARKTVKVGLRKFLAAQSSLKMKIIDIDDNCWYQVKVRLSPSKKHFLFASMIALQKW